MPVVSIISPDRAIFSCYVCGREFEAAYRKPNGPFANFISFAQNRSICHECHDRQEQERAEREQKERERMLISTVTERMQEAGFVGVFAEMEKPWLRDTAVWFWRHRNDHLLACGETGTGKTSGAAFAIREIMKQGYPKVMYRTWQMLQAELVAAKTDDYDNEVKFFRRLNAYDYIIIDELIGKRGESAKLSPTGQDLLFNLIDGAYSGARKARVWILGNFYRGALERLIDDPQPTRRRLQEAFKIAWLEPGKPVDESLKVF